jgi:hypothetical protein
MRHLHYLAHRHMNSLRGSRRNRRTHNAAQATTLSIIGPDHKQGHRSYRNDTEEHVFDSRECPWKTDETRVYTKNLRTKDTT